MNVQEVGDGIETALKAIPNLKVYRRGFRGAPALPCAQIFPPDEVNYNMAFQKERRGFMEATFVVQFRVHLSKLDGQDLMEEFLGTESERSIYLALTADRTLGGAVSEIHSLGGITRSYRFNDAPDEWIDCIDFQLTAIVGPRATQAS